MANRYVSAFLKFVGAGACLGIGFRMLTLFEQPLIFPVFPNIFDWASLILVGVYLGIDGIRSGRH